MTTFCVAVMNCLTSHPFSFLLLPGVPISIRWAHACPLTVSSSALRHRKLASLWKLLEQVQTILFSYPSMIGIKDPLPGPCSLPPPLFAYVFTLHLSPSSFICWFRRLDSYLWARTSQFWMMLISCWNYRICFFLPFSNSSHSLSAAASTVWPFYAGGWALCMLGMRPAAEFYPQPELTFEYCI